MKGNICERYSDCCWWLDIQCLERLLCLLSCVLCCSNHKGSCIVKHPARPPVFRWLSLLYDAGYRSACSEECFTVFLHVFRVCSFLWKHVLLNPCSNVCADSFYSGDGCLTRTATFDLSSYLLTYGCCSSYRQKKERLSAAFPHILMKTSL